jgi:hypothetical protein
MKLAGVKKGLNTAETVRGREIIRKFAVNFGLCSSNPDCRTYYPSRAKTGSLTSDIMTAAPLAIAF